METSRPSFRNLTNSLLAPIVALKYADESGRLSVNFFYHMLFNLGPVLHCTVTAMRFLSFGFLKGGTVSPH